MKVVSVIWAILRGLLWALADEFPLGGRKTASHGAGRKERPWWTDKPAADNPAADNPAAKTRAPDAPTTDRPAADKAKAPTWWAKPAPPSSPPTIKVETDAGTFITRVTFSGDHMLGIRRVERPRQEGESRRRRRPGDKATSPISPMACEAAEQHARELAVPQVPPDVEPVTHAAVEMHAREPAIPQAAPAEATGARIATRNGAAGPIGPSEATRVARARRVRSRLAPADTAGSPLLATTLATRLALTDATRTSPASSAAAKKVDGA